MQVHLQVLVVLFFDHDIIKLNKVINNNELIRKICRTSYPLLIAPLSLFCTNIKMITR